jgi:ribonuclease HII
MRRRSITEIKEQLSTAETLPDDVRELLQKDTRVGVRRLLEVWQRRRKRQQRAIEQFRRLNVFEEKLRAEGYTAVAGIDEAGRGPLAGPVIAAAVMLDPQVMIPGLNDSKQLTAARRRLLFGRIKTYAEAFGVGIVQAQEIDRMNIYQAARKAMTLAVRRMDRLPDYLLIDAMRLNVPMPQQSLIKGDARSNSVAAASIVAKVTRDHIMEELDRRYPGYGFAANKGYGTRQHLEALHRLGPCPEHRMTFAPLKS